MNNSYFTQWEVEEAKIIVLKETRDDFERQKS